MLNGLNLQISPGEFILVLGPSGCGKSIFGLCFNGIIPQVMNARCYKGEVLINGKNPFSTPIAQMATEVGLVFQDPDAQLCCMCVEDEIVFGMENLLMPKELIRDRLDNSLNMVNLQEYKDAYTWGLSGGQKQRLAIASVLAMEPKVLVLDEPTSNLDPQGANEVITILKRIREEKENISIIAIDHKVDELISVVDRLIIFDQGNAILDGKPREILKEHGYALRDLGVNLPQMADLFLDLPEEIRSTAKEFPLTIDEVTEVLTPFKNQLEEAENITGMIKCQIPLVKIKDVMAGYPQRKDVLKDVNLEINRGDFLAIIGQNGSGKTTLTKLLIGLQQPYRGTITIHDQNIEKMDIAHLTEKVGYVFQYPDNQLITDTVYDEVAYSLRLRKTPEEKVNEMVNYALDTVGLSKTLMKRHPLTLSMGEKRRLSIATMLTLDQDLLILDEPTMGLDWGVLSSIMNLCAELNKAGKTIIYVTHDMRCVAEWASRVVVIDEGRIWFDGHPGEYFSLQELQNKTLLGKPSICRLSEKISPHQNRVYLSNAELIQALKIPGLRRDVS
ncbi:hypothetical protein DCMF_14730 [Candidatus Formimonas warabiya]|uniref:ABC transporter domain-containing protein n=1 Tax=Formimonas warabiya TaxID=1761012 RepID=A0A3G1KUJ0_FORW1|nr:energy-coupling factor transporter ATPase [Candidatus Formimonas warabiya]ATW25855.1 hypothetical protein DCMF_14730 [Candidatus Formimonas warabiya]